MSYPGLKHGERGTVDVDGEEVEVWDHVSVSQHHYVNSVNGYETFEADIYEGDMGGHGPTPDAVTKRVAVMLYDEFGINVDDHGIRTVDMSRDDAQQL